MKFGKGWDGLQKAWQIYDELISASNAKEKIADIIFGTRWTVLRTETNHFGVAAVQCGKVPDKALYIGKSLAEVAPLIKSWNLEEASLGLCAINASLNQVSLFPPQDNPNAFLRYRNLFFGKKVAVVGHFAYLEEKIQRICDLYILERNPHGDDLPDPACEYLLPDMDVVIITGSAFVNKTMPRLLELSKNAFTIISGPSTPMSKALFTYGADSLCGFCCQSPDIWQVASGMSRIFSNGQMVCLEK